MGAKTAISDEAVAWIAARQHGMVTARQLESAGVRRRGIAGRVKAGRLHRIHRGVYAVGHRGLSRDGKYMAAVLACGPDALLSHGHAAALLALLQASPGPVSVTVPSHGGRAKRSGIRIHRSTTLAPEQTWRRRNIPCTSPARTLADLRGAVSAATLRRATRQAAVLGYPLDESSPEPTRSELEYKFLRFCRRHQIPSPQAGITIGRFEVDFLWPVERLVVETDGWTFHRGRQAFEDDRSRDLELRRRGYQVLRVTYRQVIDEPPAVAAALRAALVLPRCPNPN